jgi:hypothetical protein
VKINIRLNLLVVETEPLFVWSEGSPLVQPPLASVLLSLPVFVETRFLRPSQTTSSQEFSTSILSPSPNASLASPAVRVVICQWSVPQIVHGSPIDIHNQRNLAIQTLRKNIVDQHQQATRGPGILPRQGSCGPAPRTFKP